MKKTIAVLIGALSINSALACKPGNLGHEIHFIPESSALENTQIRALVDWYEFNRLGRGGAQGIEYLGIYANATSGNAKTIRMAQARIDNVARLISTADPDVRIRSKSIDKWKPSAPQSYAIVNTVALNVQPACAKTQSCCP